MYQEPFSMWLQCFWWIDNSMTHTLMWCARAFWIWKADCENILRYCLSWKMFFLTYSITREDQARGYKSLKWNVTILQITTIKVWTTSEIFLEIYDIFGIKQLKSWADLNGLYFNKKNFRLVLIRGSEVPTKTNQDHVFILCQG